MMTRLRQSSLLWKLWISQSLVMAIVITVVCLALDHYGAIYLMALMKQFHLSPAPLHYMFTERLHFIARTAGVAGALVGAPVCFFLIMGITRPLEEIVRLAGRLADGDRMAKLQTNGPDEVQRLARAFNELVDRLQQRETMQKFLVANVAHELRTPLTNIRGYLEALTDEVLPPSKEIFRSLHDETLLLTRVVDHLFDLAEATSAANNLALSPTSLAAVVDRALVSCQSQSEAKNIRVETSFEPGAAEILADTHRIVQIMRNLLQNAMEHTPPGGHIQVTAQNHPDEIKMVVQDSGVGIKDADLPFIFDRFFRGGERSSKEPRGAGLGLAIVKELVTAHGGRVGADSSERGARVWFTLPKRIH
jgi:signal transduction histidine kinase